MGFTERGVKGRERHRGESLQTSSFDEASSREYYILPR
jgi:hypothetical protein